MKKAFTLIELLVVIAIIGVLAGLLFAGFGTLQRRQRLARTQAELAQVELACDRYQARLGFYPPDHPTDPARAPLYYELAGAYLLDATSYGVETNGAHALTASQTTAYLGRGGFANALPVGPQAPPRFLPEHAPVAVALTIPQTTNEVRLLTLTAAGPPVPGLNEGVNPIYYQSTHPTHNVRGVDLWAYVTVGRQTWRVSNWSAPEREP